MEPLHALLARQNQSPRPAEENNPHKDDDSHTGAIVGPIIGVIFLILALIAGWYAYRVYRARRLGLPPPSVNPFSPQPSINTRNYPARGGLVGWIQAKYRSMRSGRTAGGAYEGAAPTGRRFGRNGALDPDDAWDSRMDREADADYEEQELGLTHSRHTSDLRPYAGGGYEDVRTGYAPTGRGLPRDDELDDRYEEETGRSTRGRDPFSDDHAARHSDVSLREASPRPYEPEAASGHGAGLHSGKDSSPTERRSVFRENM